MKARSILCCLICGMLGGRQRPPKIQMLEVGTSSWLRGKVRYHKNMCAPPWLDDPLPQPNVLLKPFATPPVALAISRVHW